MASQTLARWRENGWIEAVEPTRSEVEDLLGIASRDLQQSQIEGLNSDWRLAIAYNAALQLAAAALLAAGYRASRDQHHYRLIQSLAITIELDREEVSLLDVFRKKRNLSSYERSGTTTDTEARELSEFTESLRDRVESWIRETRPRLLGS